MRPLTVLAARIVKARPILVTFLTSTQYIDRVETEVSRSFNEEEGALRTLIRYAYNGFGLTVIPCYCCVASDWDPNRVIAMPIENHANPLIFDGINNAFISTYKQLVSGDPVKCIKSNIIYDSTIVPTAVVLDVGIIRLIAHSNVH